MVVWFSDQERRKWQLRTRDATSPNAKPAPQPPQVTPSSVKEDPWLTLVASMLISRNYAAILRSKKLSHGSLDFAYHLKQRAILGTRQRPSIGDHQGSNHRTTLDPATSDKRGIAHSPVLALRRKPVGSDDASVVQQSRVSALATRLSKAMVFSKAQHDAEEPYDPKSDGIQSNELSAPGNDSLSAPVTCFALPEPPPGQAQDVRPIDGTWFADFDAVHARVRHLTGYEFRDGNNLRVALYDRPILMGGVKVKDCNYQWAMTGDSLLKTVWYAENLPRDRLGKRMPSEPPEYLQVTDLQCEQTKPCKHSSWRPPTAIGIGRGAVKPAEAGRASRSDSICSPPVARH